MNDPTEYGLPRYATAAIEGERAHLLALDLFRAMALAPLPLPHQRAALQKLALQLSAPCANSRDDIPVRCTLEDVEALAVQLRRVFHDHVEPSVEDGLEALLVDLNHALQAEGVE